MHLVVAKKGQQALCLVHGESNEVDDEEVVGVPEDLKEGPPDELHRGSDHEEEDQHHHVTSHASNSREADDKGVQVWTVDARGVCLSRGIRASLFLEESKPSETLVVVPVGSGVDGAPHHDGPGEPLVEGDVLVQEGPHAARRALAAASHKGDEVTTNGQQDQSRVEVDHEGRHTRECECLSRAHSHVGELRMELKPEEVKAA